MAAPVALRGLHEIAADLRSEGIDVAEIVKGQSYEDCSVLAVVPTRGLIHPKVVQSLVQLAKPMNQKFAYIFVEGHEVGIAYNKAVDLLLHDPRFKSFKWLLTIEDDNIIPSMAIYMLLESAINGGFDVVGGLYHVKGPLSVPMAFGIGGSVDEDGRLDFRPLDLTDTLLEQNPKAVAVNGLACGCTLFRRSVFEEMEPPWFQTWTRLNGDGTIEIVTQDLDFCRKANANGKKLAIDTRVRVGHIDVQTGVIY